MTPGLHLAVLLAALLAVLPPLAAQEPVPPPELVLRAVGEGRAAEGATGGAARLMARRAATVTALHNLGLAVRAMVPGAAEEPPAEDGWTRDVVRGHRIASTEDLPDGSARVTVELPIAQLAVHLHLLHAQRAALEAQLKAREERIAQLEREAEALRAELTALGQRFTALTEGLGRQLEGLRALLERASAR